MSATIDLLNSVNVPTKSSSNFKGTLHKRINNDIESFSTNNDSTNFVNTDLNGFIGALHTAYSSHYALTLSPDDIWLCIAQGFSIYVNQHAEELRSFFVDFEGKKIIRVRRDSFRRFQDNPWENVFDEFSSEIKKNIGEDNHKNIVADFTTTGIIEKAVSEIVLMESMKSYFDYRVMTCCCIPKINLLGVKEDWEKILQKAAALKQYKTDTCNIDWWIDNLVPALQKFVDVFDGNVDESFWKQIYKLLGGSGGDRCSGWCNLLFPYVKKGSEFVVNKELAADESDIRFFSRGINTSDYPSGVSKVPFIWEYFEENFDYLFFGGFHGHTVLEDNSIKPTMFWAVGEDAEKAQVRKDKALIAHLDKDVIKTVSEVQNGKIFIHSSKVNGLIEKDYLDNMKQSLKFVAMLNELLLLDYKNIFDLVEFKVPTTKEIEDHKYVVVGGMRKDGKLIPALRWLGIVNGVLLKQGFTKICIHYNEDLNKIDYFSLLEE